jgi:two-component system chemotaxis response regulator CheY
VERVLIVDDSAVLRKILRLHLEHDSAWEVCGEAENGQVAIEKVRQLRPDLVILDLLMPVMDGLEAARQIRSIAPRTLMVLYTMQNSEGLLPVAQAAGVEDVISKSDGATTLLSALDALRHHGEERSA